MAALNKNIAEKFDKICRVCLEIKKDMRPLFDQLTATMLMGISKVQVAVGDGLPAQLCMQCVHQISRCHAFKDMVERNDSILQQHAKIRLEEQLKKEQEEKEKILNMNCTDPYIHYMEVPSATQILDNFFPTSPEQQADSNIDELQKVEYVVEVQPDATPTTTEVKSKDEGLNSEEENYLQLVVFQTTSTVSPGRHVCNLCHKEFKHPRWLKQHMRSHSNWIKANCKKPPMCTICDRTFKGPGMLKMHMRTHEQRPPKQPTCSVCQRTFASKTLLYRHRQTHFEQKTHECTVCEKRFYSGYALRSHMARHRGERPYVCSTCNKSFYNPTDLKVHFRLHTGEKPLKCSECNKTFRRHSTLCQHMKKHRGIRNHVCAVCNKGFYEVSKLNAHMRVHTGERPYECQYCERRFAQQSALIYHRRTHTGEKPYSCKLCAARFTTSSARNNHLLTHAGSKRFTCPVCLKSCATRTELRIHSAKHVDEKLDKNEGEKQPIDKTEKSAEKGASEKEAGVKSAGDKLPCDTCGSQRRRHDTHYQCTVCGKMFCDANAYKRHTRCHEPADDAPAHNDDAQETVQEEEIVPESHMLRVQSDGTKRYKCALCNKTYINLHNLRKHLALHAQERGRSTDQVIILQPQQAQQQQQQQVQQQQQQQQVQQQQQQQQQQVQQQLQQQLQQVTQQQVQACALQQQVLQVGAVPQLAVPLHANMQGQHSYPVISSVQSLQLQQSQHVNTQPQQLQVQTIQIHPQHQPLQIHAVGVQQVQQQQLHVATSSCQTMLPNILQLQPGAVAVSGLGGELGVTHRIILQPPAPHPAVYTIHH